MIAMCGGHPVHGEVIFMVRWVIIQGLSERLTLWKNDGEQAQIIFTAYRPIEDKLQALMEILKKDGECEEREELEQAVCYYKAAMERMKPGEG